MGKKVKKIDFTMLKLSPEHFKKLEDTYVFKSDMIIEGSTLVSDGSNMATMIVSSRIPKGTTVSGHNEDGVFIFESEGGETNSGQKYNGRVRYSFNVSDDVLNNVPAPLDSEEGKKELKKRKTTSTIVKLGVIAASVGVGYGISKILKIKPLPPMLITPLVVFAGLVVLDQMAWNKAVSGGTKK